jgi:ferredoxin
MKLGEFDPSGRRRPEPIEGSRFTLAFNNVIAAIGQKPEIPASNFELTIGRGNTITVDPATMNTSREGVFAGGDAVSGPASVIEAITDGRRAATSIDWYLGGEGDIDEKLAPDEGEIAPPTELHGEWRPEITTIPLKKRLRSFEEVEKGPDREAAQKEARRCMRCDLSRPVAKYEADMGICIFCGLCVEACPYDALFLSYGYENSEYQRNKLKRCNETIAPSPTRQPSGYCRPKIAETLPQQTLLINQVQYFDWMKKKKNNGN